MGPQALLAYLCSVPLRHFTWKPDIWRTGGQAVMREESLRKKLTLAELPTDVILAITDQLDDFESRVLLSLACKRFYSIFILNMDMSFPDHSTKIRFLQIYERDLPDDLTCRLCGRLFKWRTLVAIPGFRLHSPSARCVAYQRQCLQSQRIPSQRLHWFDTNTRCIPLWREQIDLTLKADELGEQYGLPVSDLNMYSAGREDFQGVRRTYEVRLVKGELLIVTTMLKEVSSWEEAQKLACLLCHLTCPHWKNVSEPHGISDTMWPVLSTMSGPGETDLFKCRYCRTQHRFSMYEHSSDALIVVQVKIWKSLGSRYDNSICNEQMFQWNRPSDVVVNNLSQEDLEVRFNSGSKN